MDSSVATENNMVRFDLHCNSHPPCSSSSVLRPVHLDPDGRLLLHDRAAGGQLHLRGALRQDRAEAHSAAGKSHLCPGKPCWSICLKQVGLCSSQVDPNSYTPTLIAELFKTPSAECLVELAVRVRLCWPSQWAWSTAGWRRGCLASRGSPTPPSSLTWSVGVFLVLLFVFLCCVFLLLCRSIGLPLLGFKHDQWVSAEKLSAGWSYN